MRKLDNKGALKQLNLVRLSKRFYTLKVNKFQNEFIKSSFLPKYEQKIVRISPVYSKKFVAVFTMGELGILLSKFTDP